MVFRIMTGELPTLGQATCCPAFYPCDPGSEGSCEVGGAQLREQNLWYGNIPFRGSEVLGCSKRYLGFDTSLHPTAMCSHVNLPQTGRCLLQFGNIHEYTVTDIRMQGRLS